MMMKVKPFSYHIPPRRKAFMIPVLTNTSTSTSTSSYSSLSNANTSWSSERRNNICRNKISRDRNAPSGNSRRSGGMNMSMSNNNKGYLSTTAIMSLSPISITTSNAIQNLSSLCGVGGGTVLILVLLGFIGVAGQGKLQDIDSVDEASSSHLTPSNYNYRFPQPRFFLPYSTNLYSFDDTDNDNENDNEEVVDDDDEALQLRISSMGQYGTRYRNNSYRYFPKYSRDHPYYLQGSKYKVGQGQGPIYGGAYPPLQSLQPPTNFDTLVLSLLGKDKYNNKSTEDYQSLPPTSRNVNMNKSGETQEKNKNSQKVAKTSNDDENANKKAKLSSEKVLESPNVNNSSRKNKLFNNNATLHHHHQQQQQQHPTPQRFLNSFDNSSKVKQELYDGDDVILDFPEIDPLNDKRTSESGSTGANQETDDYDQDILEKFIPGNMSHLSGKLKFRQSSQAELDGAVDLTDNSLSSESSSRRRPRRSVVHLYDMVVCSTGCNPLIFKGYGCYCGFLGSGLTVDGIDKCCAKHDWCYHHAKCPPLLTYFVPYYWTCNHGRPQCVTDFRGWKGICGAHLCECDRQFAECLKKFPCPRSRAMCLTSPMSNSHQQSDWHADSRAFPFTVNRRPRFPHWENPPMPPPPRFPVMIPFPPHSHPGRLF